MASFFLGDFRVYFILTISLTPFQKIASESKYNKPVLYTFF